MKYLRQVTPNPDGILGELFVDLGACIENHFYVCVWPVAVDVVV